jgi:hypothetical protein
MLFPRCNFYLTDRETCRIVLQPARHKAKHRYDRSDPTRRLLVPEPSSAQFTRSKNVDPRATDSAALHSITRGIGRWTSEAGFAGRRTAP